MTTDYLAESHMAALLVARLWQRATGENVGVVPNVPVTGLAGFDVALEPTSTPPKGSPPPNTVRTCVVAWSRAELSIPSWVDRWGDVFPQFADDVDGVAVRLRVLGDPRRRLAGDGWTDTTFLGVTFALDRQSLIYRAASVAA